jgi:hypothetical protein
MLGVYILDGLAPSPKLVQKMQPQSTQDPLMVPPAKDKCPNFKVDEFRWLRHIWKEAWILAQGFSLDEQTCIMQGESEYKTRCGKFKRIGDGLQGDCIADNGYTWDFYFHNDATQSSSCKGIARCTAGFCTCL